MAESVENGCSAGEPCLVCLAWSLQSHAIVLKEQRMPVLNTSLPTPKFTVVNDGSVTRKLPSEYLGSGAWVDALKLVVKGVDAVPINDNLMVKADIFFTIPRAEA